MGKYTNEVDQENAKSLGFGATADSGWKLAQMLQQQSLQSQQNAAEGQRQQAGFKQQKEMLPLESKNKLAEKQGETDINQKTLMDNLQTIQDQAKMGRKINLKSGATDASQADTNPYIQQSKLQNKEGTDLAHMATKAFQPINDQAQAVKATVDNLNLGNPTGDSAAIMNEVKALSGSSRGMLGLMQAMGGHPTANTKLQDAQNYVMNQAQSGLQPAQRNAMREFAFSRTGQLRDQHKQISDTLNQTAPSYANSLAASGQLPGLVSSYGASPKQALDSLDQLHQQYTQQKGNDQVSNNSIYSQQPSNVDKLKSFFGFGGKSPQQPNPTQQSKPPMSFEEFKAKKAAGAL